MKLVSKLLRIPLNILRVPNPNVTRWTDLVRQVLKEKESDLPVAVVLAFIDIESSGNPKARSKSNARGLMQIIPKWWLKAGETEDMLYDPLFNVRRGVAILKWLYSTRHTTSEVVANYYGKNNADWPHYVEKFWQAYNKYKSIT
jgi:soluble lytic murein transglycosylase-like protein